MQPISLLLAAAALLPGPLQDSKARAELFVRPAPQPAAAGAVQAAIRIKIQPGWHLYHDELGQPDSVGRPTSVAFEGVDGQWSRVVFPEPHRTDQPGLGEDGRDTWIWSHEGTIVLYAAGRLSEGAEAAGVVAKLKGLTCQDDGSCIPWSASARSKGAGSDTLWTGFPADLRAPAAAAADEPAAPAPEQAPSTSGPLAGARGGLLAATGLGGGEDKARAKLYVRRQGERVRAAIEITVAPGWHLYHDELGQPDSVGKPTTVEMQAAGIVWGRAVFPEPERLEQPGVGDGGRDTWIWGHSGRIVVYVTGSAGPSADPASVRASLRGLTCQDDGSCIPWGADLKSAGEGPERVFEGFVASLVPGPEPGAAGTTGSAAQGAGAIDWSAVAFPDYEPRGTAEKRSLPLWLLFAFIAGIILNVMPCVLPVVSIKVLSFVQQAGESRKRIFELGLAFSAGILIVFIALAALAAFAGKGWGEQFQSQTFLVVMIGIVFGFSLSLFDVYEIGVPQQVGQLAAQRREGMVDAFFKGMMATILATPCSGPFLGSTLAWALTQPASVIFLIFLFVGLGMAAPYVVLTANPGFLKYVPKPGPWMQTFKHLMGFLLLGTVVFLMVSLRQDLHVYTAAFLVYIGLACWIWGRFATFDQSLVKRLGTLATVLLVLGLGARLTFVDMRAFFAGPGEGAGHLVWEDFDPVRLQRYHEQGRSVFIDFTADWCLTCKTNEKLVYESDTIVDLLAQKNVVAIRADETDDSPKTQAIQRLREKLGARSIPFMAVFCGDDWQRPYTLKDLVTVGQVSEILAACPEPARAESAALRVPR